ncbi:MAG: YjdF family protein [Coprobacillus sp.]
MDKISQTLTVFFEDPFWVGVIEEVNHNQLVVSRIVFYQEPKDYEIFHYLLYNYSQLKFSPSVEMTVKQKHVNPKRLQKMIKHQVNSVGVGTKSQQALKKQQELNKQESIQFSRQHKEAEKAIRFALKQQKKKMKHRGK